MATYTQAELLHAYKTRKHALLLYIAIIHSPGCVSVRVWERACVHVSARTRQFALKPISGTQR